MWQAYSDSNGGLTNIKKHYATSVDLYLPSAGLVGLYRRDLLSSLVSAGCCHLAVKILGYLDSPSLLAASLVCTEWQQLLLDCFYAAPKFRSRVWRAIFEPTKPTHMSRLNFSLAMARAAIVDVAVDDDLNLFALAILAGRPHVMSCSLFTQGKRRWVHRFTEHFPPSSLTCMSAGQSLVALGSKDGRIHVYEASRDFKSLRLTAILAHHCGAIHSILFSSGRILSCSDDMTVGVVTVLSDGSLMLSKLLHGHVSRVRALDAQADRVLSGSDDRSVKLWSLAAGAPATSVCTLTGHSGPVTGVLLALPLALSAAGCTVRVWDVNSTTCLKLLQHGDSPVTAMTWISTFRGVATVDASSTLRCFKLEDLETIREEIVSAATTTDITAPDSSLNASQNQNQNNCTTTLQNYSPKQSLKFYGSRDPRLVTAWPDNAILKLESIPHHFTAFAIRNQPQPTITVHCLDYVL